VGERGELSGWRGGMEWNGAREGVITNMPDSEEHVTREREMETDEQTAVGLRASD